MAKESSDTTEMVWGPPPEVFSFKSEEEFEQIKNLFQESLSHTFRNFRYNTAGTFVELHKAYRSQSELDLWDFMSQYKVVYKDLCLSCVGLGKKVLKYVIEKEPSLEQYLYFAVANDCPSVDSPVPTKPPPALIGSQYEHSLIVLEFRLEDRAGYLIGDAGHGIYRPVVIMRDGLSPHTGTFPCQARTGRRELTMYFVDQDDLYAVWLKKEFREDGQVKEHMRMLYLERCFLYPDELDLRNRARPYHGHIYVGDKGIFAGIFIVLGKDDGRFKLFVPDKEGKTISVRLPYDYFLSGSSQDLLDEDPEQVDSALNDFAQVFGFEGRQKLMEHYRPFSEACCDKDFIKQVLEIHAKLWSDLFTIMFSV